MYKLNQKTKSSVKKHTGLEAETISSMEFKNINSSIEKKIGKKLKHNWPKDSRLIGRGSVYLFLWRLIGIKEINRYLSKI